MICYKDRTFCQYYNCAKVQTCDRVLSKRIKQDAIDFGLPVCVYSAKPECFVQDMDYQEGY